MQAPSPDAPSAAGARHAGPHAGIVGCVFTLIFLAGLAPVTWFGGRPYFPGPGNSPATIVAFFRARPEAVRLCAFLHFGAAVALGIYTVTVVNQLRFLGVRAAGASIALFGGLATALNMFASSSALWALSHPGVTADGAVVQAFYWLQTAFGAAGFSVPLGLLFAGICVPAARRRLLPGWLVVFGFVLAVAGELSWLDLISLRALFLVPLTRFLGFVWLIAAGFALPRIRLPGSAVSQT